MSMALLEAALRSLGEEIERVEWNRTQEIFDAPTGNNGGEYETDKFKMRAFCWCDETIHPDGCPPNFEWRDYKVEWYKYLGRGMHVKPEMTPDLIAEMLDECLKSVQAKDVDLESGDKHE
jgi:hypothetical protein